MATICEEQREAFLHALLHDLAELRWRIDCQRLWLAVNINTNINININIKDNGSNSNSNSNTKDNGSNSSSNHELTVLIESGPP